MKILDTLVLMSDPFSDDVMQEHCRAAVKLIRRHNLRVLEEKTKLYGRELLRDLYTDLLNWSDKHKAIKQAFFNELWNWVVNMSDALGNKFPKPSWCPRSTVF